MTPARLETRRVHLRVLGQDREIDLPAPAGRATLGDLVPAAREVSRRAMEISVARGEDGGEVVQCRAGCAACCRQLVPISVVEARAVARGVAALPPDRREAVRARFAAAVEAMEQIGLVDRAAPPGRMLLTSAIAEPRAAWSDVVRRYFAAQIACPLLEGERCSLYEDRPIVCREHLVTTPPSRCAEIGGARAVPRPAPGSEALATAARELTGDALPMLALPLSIEWTEAAGSVLDLETDGDNLLNHLLSAFDQITDARTIAASS